jgi:hypothetical protein
MSLSLAGCRLSSNDRVTVCGEALLAPRQIQLATGLAVMVEALIPDLQE